MKTNKPDEIPEDIYVGFVRALFTDASILLLGALTQGLVGLLVYFSYGRHKSTIALEETQGLAIRQPRVN